MKRCSSSRQRCAELTGVELLDREIDPKHLLDRGARLDVLARTGEGVLINIEVQVANQYNIDKRTMYYWAGLGVTGDGSLTQK
ncbi:MAG: PD-(D/E)XK nuclease family transposase [Thermoanaerobacteraceae bacterium]|nr:PD-(D/E)XK nuclease family transposase [Thermoanaerobacteraceae bacterium]